jgi:hypothetical protein
VLKFKRLPGITWDRVKVFTLGEETQSLHGVRETGKAKRRRESDQLMLT